MHRCWPLAFLLIAGACLAPCLHAAEQYPYTAYVTAEQVNVVSGPGTRYYLTHRLFAGDEVQVYRREATGWLAIRPPEDSFSWIPADVVEETNDAGVYRVLSETPSWIGTPDKSILDHHYQVKLRPGELVEVIGERQVRTEGGSEVWLKIMPPAGEFRWIHLNQVSKVPPREQELAALRERKTSGEPREYPEVPAAIGTGVNRVKESLAALQSLSNKRNPNPEQPAMILSDLNSRKNADDVRVVDHQLSAEPVRDYSVSSDGFVPRKPRKIENSAGVPAPSSELRMASREQMQNSAIGGFSRSTLVPAGNGGSTVQPLATARHDGPAFDPANAGEQLTQLDLELSLRVARPRETWNLQPLRNQVQKIVDSGVTPQERGQARLLLEKIRRFEETFEMPHDPLLAAHSKGIAGASPADARYDGVGLLQPVLTRDGSKAIASYALVDQEGNPVAFVTPGPGMNLRRYENKPVGIYGKRGMVEALRKPHLVAERVIDLSTR